MPKSWKINLSDRELFYLSWPIFVEIFLRVVISNINVFMISSHSEPAVAAVGAANQLLNLSVYVYGFITVGTQIIIAQLIGAKRQSEIPKVITTALFGAVGIGMLISLSFLLFPTQLLQFMNLDADLVSIGKGYMQIYGGSLFISSITATIVAVLRSHGLTKPALLIPMTASILAVCGNFVALYSPFGLPYFGVNGLAWASVFGNTIGLLIASRLLFKFVNFNILKTKTSLFSKDYIKSILTLGLPSSGEAFSYQAAQIVVTMIVATLGQSVLVAKSYITAITQFVYLIANSLAQGNQIIIGRKVGARDLDGAYTRGVRTIVIATLITLFFSILTFIFIEPIMSIFTTNPEVITIAKWVFLVDIILEAARAVNMVMVNALNASGDVKFPLFASLMVLWVISLPFSYTLAIPAGLGLVGVWMAYSIDEVLRSFLMIHRWRSGVWRTKSTIVQEQ
ncbi:MATE family efflux transporter [Vagococcus coleopterorum]|uniref:MATE family efflux transporter n=1 Tax=Vagococcus coleopterorum TaxID=2714946 RepID=A0A6G8AP35_9ENTE|nr:MATE family efflux transporter [Vagococcus coleopterorum]QIL46729.1 MATE family efflux transporter [Vagococcus coleopterorum]